MITPSPVRTARMAGLMLALLCTTATFADTSVSNDLTLASAYVWRGMTFTDGAVFQPAVTTSHSSGFSFNAWGNLDIDDANGLSGDFQEVDLTVAFTLPLSGKLGVDVGYIEYLFPNEVGPGTREVFVALSLDAAVTPSLTVYYDFDEVDDVYANLAVSTERSLGDRWTLGLRAAAGFGGEHFAELAGGVDAGLFDGRLTTTATYAAPAGWSVGLLAEYVTTLDDDALPDQDVGLIGGVFFHHSF